MSEPARVSFVTPVYNGERYLEQCIESVLGQTYDRWEYVILDNASTDATPDILRRSAEAEPRIRVQRNPDTLPYIQNWNRAVGLMDPASEYCKIVHADDWLMPDCLEAMVDVAERHPEVGIVGSWIQRGEEIMARWMEVSGEVIRGRELGRLSLLAEIPYLLGSPSALLLRSDFIRTREELYENVGHPLVDQHLCYDLLRRTDFGYVPRVLSFNRLHDESITAAQEETNEWFVGKLSLLAQFGPEYLTDEELEAKVDHYLGRYYRFLAEQVGRRRGRDFWEYHRNALERLGHEFDRGLTYRIALRIALSRLRRGIDRILK